MSKVLLGARCSQTEFCICHCWRRGFTARKKSWLPEMRPSLRLLWKTDGSCYELFFRKLELSYTHSKSFRNMVAETTYSGLSCQASFIHRIFNGLSSIINKSKAMLTVHKKMTTS